MFDLSIKNKVLFFIIALFGVSFVGFLSVLTNFQNNKMQEIQTERLSPKRVLTSRIKRAKRTEKNCSRAEIRLDVFFKNQAL